MPLSRLAQELAAEIAQHDWQDAPYRMDRAGHSRVNDSDAKRSKNVLSEEDTDRVRTNVMWVVAQTLGYSDPNFDVYEFAEACGVNTRTKQGAKDGSIASGLRTWHGQYARPGTWTFDPLTEVITTNTSDYYHATEQCDMFRRGYQGATILRFSASNVPTAWRPCPCIQAPRA
ncbi:hypothetical protein ACLCDR_19150 [Streptomyces cavourensis]|uniref:hypothetical protein n=1 Tax=Streptomyces TaxID=1883 RepID=UPI001D1853F8|nr:hypothetical protein [Streptomyces anulatus]